MPLDFIFGADFADLFEVRGLKRARRGRRFAPTVGLQQRPFLPISASTASGASLRLDFEPKPDALDGGGASYLFTLEPDERKEIEVRVTGGMRGSARLERSALSAPLSASLAARRSEISWFRGAAWSGITASNGLMDTLLRRSCADLTSIIRDGPEGTFMMAGIPWFATLFGRDSIMTALFALPFNPDDRGRNAQDVGRPSGIGSQSVARRTTRKDRA